MTWEDRIKEAAATSPSGRRFVFLFGDVSEGFTAKGTAFEFPDFSGTFLQDLGRSGLRFPFILAFSGPDYDLTAAEFFGALYNERGLWRLEHPLYGEFDVGHLGDVTRRDDLVTAANQAVFEITFLEATDLFFPRVQADPGAAVLRTIDDYFNAAPAQFAEEVDLDSTLEAVALRDKWAAELAEAKKTLAESVSEQIESVQDVFNNSYDSINNSINTLIDDPLTLAAQTVQFVHALATGAVNIKNRLNSYATLARSIFNRTGSVQTPGVDSQNSNAFWADYLFASAAVTGAVVSVVNAEFETKREALEAAEEVLIIQGEMTEWLDENIQSLEEIDTGETYQKTQEAAAVAAGFLVQISFELKQERGLVLTEPRHFIELCAELYGLEIDQVDDKLDFFILSNDFTGSELLTIPKGRRVVYYI